MSSPLLPGRVQLGRASCHSGTVQPHSTLLVSPLSIKQTFAPLKVGDNPGSYQVLHRLSSKQGKALHEHLARIAKIREG